MATKSKTKPKKKSATATEIKGNDSRAVSAANGKRELWAIILFAFAVLLIFLVFVKGKSVWTFMHNAVFGISGICAYILPIIVGVIAIFCAMDRLKSTVTVRVVESCLLLVFLQAAIDIFSTSESTVETFGEHLVTAYQNGTSISGGGFLGGLIGNPIFMAFGKVGAAVTVCLILFIIIMLLTGTTLLSFFRTVAKPVQKIEKQAEVSFSAAKARKEEREDPSKWDIPIDDIPEKRQFVNPSLDESSRHVIEAYHGADTESVKGPIFNDADAIETDSEKKEKKTKPETVAESENQNKGKDIFSSVDKIKNGIDGNTDITEDESENLYAFPQINLLKENTRRTAGLNERELQNTAENLVNVLRSFGVETRIVDISRGPTVTRYELQPSAGVKISKITGLSDDIALNLATAGVRIEAPIPNKAAVGIEVPNKSNAMVGVREIIESDEYVGAKSKLTVVLGRDIAGKAVVTDIAKMPHGLIAGATGSGKSVCINSIIISLLYRANPDEVKFLMIDPKVVELSVYNGIPHLLVPVVTDPRKASGALGWAVTEMEKRYRLFAENDVRNLEGYNHLAEISDDIVKMPQIVIIIDELADLMMTCPGEVEDSICRIAQKARAAGMHLLIATQRPSVDVVTGLIKANIPTRIAFAVSSQTDSRTILDMGGAEKLLGKGDMLFCPVGANKPTRIQGCFVSDGEVEKVVEFIKNGIDGDEIYDDAVSNEIEKLAQAQREKGQKAVQSDSGDENDPMIEQAITCVVEAGQASTSLLQRRLKLGYARAARIVDQMESMGIVGPYEGSKPRQVLLTKAQLLERQSGQE